jgi:two-component sensor histidine kinase/PAS domain-containing protein
MERDRASANALSQHRELARAAFDPSLCQVPATGVQFRPIGRKTDMPKLFDKIEDARSLAQMIVDTVREPLLVLDGGLNIMVASSSFYRSFRLAPDSADGRNIFSLDDGAWDIPALHTLLEKELPEHTVLEGYEFSHDFPRIGNRILRLHARRMIYEGNTATILLSFEDATDRHAIEREKAELQKHTQDLLMQKEMLLAEMQHRIVNSLQIIASILMMKARAVTSTETRQHLQDAHRRVMSVAAVQQPLHISGRGDMSEIAPSLTKLCESLAESMIGESRPATLKVVADRGEMISADAVSMGLIVTELVINALKYAFPEQDKPATVTVRYEVNGTDWKLTVADNGIGKTGKGKPLKGGLGTSLVNALAHQLEAQVVTESTPEGMTITVTHATFTALVPSAA